MASFLRDTGKSCEHCRFYDTSDQMNDANGICRRRSPVIVSVDDFRNSTCGEFPVVAIDDWCGDFEEEPDGGDL